MASMHASHLSQTLARQQDRTELERDILSYLLSNREMRLTAQERADLQGCLHEAATIAGQTQRILDLLDTPAFRG